MAKLAELLEGMKTLHGVVQTLNSEGAEPPTSTLLKQLLTYEEAGGLFPDLTSKLAFFSAHVDLKTAKATG